MKEEQMWWVYGGMWQPLHKCSDYNLFDDIQKKLYPLYNPGQCLILELKINLKKKIYDSNFSLNKIKCYFLSCFKTISDFFNLFIHLSSKIIFNSLWNELISYCEWYLLSAACSPTMVNNRVHVCMYVCIYVMFLFYVRAMQASTIFSLRRWLKECSFIFIPYDDILLYTFYPLYKIIFAFL